jgi:integration host factor alpha subunit
MVCARFWKEGGALTKIDIINLVAEDTGLSKVKAEEAVETIIATIKETLQQGESIILRRFGSFQVRSKNARIGRNPKTGEEAPISARKVVRFKSGKHFKEAMNGAPVRFF